MRQRLAAITAGPEEQHQQCQARERANQVLTAVLPAIKRRREHIPAQEDWELIGPYGG